MIEAPHRCLRLVPLWRRWFLSFLGLSLAACTSNVEDGRSKGTIPLPPGVHTVRITLEKGSISVRPTDQESIEWEAAFRKGTTAAADLTLLEAIPGELRVVEAVGSGELRIEGPRVPADLAARDPGAVVALKLVVRVPTHLGVVLKTERGPVGVADRDGPVEIHSGAGDLLLERVRGEAKVFSGGGSHMIIDHSGGLDASTQHGNFLVFVEELASSGIKLHTESGSIQCNLPSEIGFRLDASARRGAVESPFSIPKESVESGQRQVGEVGESGPTVQLSSRLGSVSVRYGSRDGGG